MIIDFVDMPLSKRLDFAVRVAGGRQEIAERLGISAEEMAGLIEGGNPSTLYLVHIAGACGVNIEWLATGFGEIRFCPDDDDPLSCAASLRIFEDIKALLHDAKEQLGLVLDPEEYLRRFNNILRALLQAGPRK